MIDNEYPLNDPRRRVERLRDALVAEVERLRGECGQAYLQGVKAGRDAERISERAAVVAFLRETLATSETAYASDDLDYAIAIIERGGHRKEEG
jgi:hypothetical protein